MHDLPSKTRTITAAENRNCIITWPLSDYKSQTSLTLLLRHYKLTNENVSYFLTNQSKTKTFIDLQVTRKPKPNKNSTRPYLNEIPVHCTHEIKTKGYDVIRVNLFLRKLRWLDWIFWGWYLPTLSINYVGMSKDMDKRLPQLYYIKTKISYDLGFIAIGVAMAT